VTLVTGGAGFIGAHLVWALCRRGHDVVVLDDLSSGRLENLASLGVEVEVLQSDIANPESLRPLAGRTVDTIFHLASQASVPQSVQHPVPDFQTNLRGTLNVLEFARDRRAQVVFPSTVSVYDRHVPKPIAETALIHASSPYGAAKAGGENYCYAYSNCYGVRTAVARLFNVYGPLMAKYVMHDFVRKLQKNPKTLTIIGTGEQVRDYTYVTDAVAALVLLAERSAPGEVYNVGSGVPTKIRDLARVIAEEMGLTDVELICTNEAAVGDIPEWYADITRLRSLGYQPRSRCGTGST
jgi:UDP-glucose 4-epimerase